jgi:hypothetical protein
MPVAAMQASQEDVRAFIQEYFDASKSTDADKILSYYTDDIVLSLPTGTLDGKSAVRGSFVVPFIAGFPGNAHSIRNLAHATNLAAVEWSFDAVHKGSFANIPLPINPCMSPAALFTNTTPQLARSPLVASISISLP